jgi:hypothetical protein
VYAGWGGLGWNGLGWAGVCVHTIFVWAGWAGLGWAGLGWAGLVCVHIVPGGVGRAGLGWEGLAWLGWAGLGCAGWAGLGWAGMKMAPGRCAVSGVDELYGWGCRWLRIFIHVFVYMCVCVHISYLCGLSGLGSGGVRVGGCVCVYVCCLHPCMCAWGG